MKETQSFFPSNIYYEGHDQHSRWFLTSLVSSVALSGQAPFAMLKTHGHLLNDDGVKMSKSDRAATTQTIDPYDLILGTPKLDGSRKFGYGLDTLRAWAISKDTDKNLFVERKDIEQVNQEVKMLRGLIRIFLGNLQNYSTHETPFEFDKLTFIDKVMTCKLLKFVKEATDAYERLDLAKVYDLMFKFVAKDLTEFYLSVSRQRLRTMSGHDEHLSS
jgi:isoleucyl-tRNA synthetase